MPANLNFEEAITNVINHSEASEAAFKIRREEEKIYFKLSDNGKGFDLEEILFKQNLKDRGRGIYFMVERARLIDGAFHIASQKGKGTKILLTFPLALKK